MSGLQHRLAAILAADAAGCPQWVPGGDGVFRKPEDLRRVVGRLRIAAGLEDSSAAETIR